MPFTMPSFPLLTQEQMGVPDIIGALTKGQALRAAMQQYGQREKLFPGELEQQKYNTNLLGVQSDFARRNAEEALKKAVAESMIKDVEAQYAGPMARLAQRGAEQKLEWDPRLHQAMINLQGAQTGHTKAETDRIRYMLEHPGYMGGASAKDIQALVDLGLIPRNTGSVTMPNAQQPTNMSATQQPSATIQEPRENTYYSGNPEAPFGTANPLVNAILNKPYASMELNRKKAEGYDWAQIPVDNRKYILSMFAGQGVGPQEALNLIKKGITPESYAAKQGLDINQIEPSYLMTPTEVKQFRQRKARMAELNSMDDFVTKGLGNYSGLQVGNYPVAQVADYLQGLNKDKQAEFLAAYALQPEIAGLRLASLNAPAGITAMHEIMNRSYGNIAPFRKLGVSEDVFNKSQKIITDRINDAVNAMNKVYTQPYLNKNLKKESVAISKKLEEGIPGTLSSEENRKKAAILLKKQSNELQNNDPLGIR